MTTICGHEREAVRRRLIVVCMRDSGHVSVDDQEYRRKIVLSNAASDVRRVELAAIHAKCDEIDALLLDPAKVAEMLAHEGRRLGIKMDSNNAAAISILVFWYPAPNGELRRVAVAMPKARTLLLQWLQLRDGAREEAERVLRGET